MKTISTFASFLLFSIACCWSIYAFHLDFEYVGPEHHYEIEKAAFERNNDNWYKEFPSLLDWLEDADRKEEALKREFGEQCVATWDFFNLEGHLYDHTTDRSLSAQAPDNWAKGERD